MTQLDHAIAGLEQALARPGRHQMWRWLVRHRLNAVQQCLAEEDASASDAWLASRQQLLAREREALRLKLDRHATQLTDALDIEGVRAELERLLGDLRRHRQRVNDLLYDAVALELGGSE